MSTAPTIPPWLSRLTPAEHERLSIAVRSFGEAWRLFWEAQCASVSRICRGEERPLGQLSGDSWDQEFVEQAKPGQAFARLREAVEELALVGVKAPSHIQGVLRVGGFDSMIRNLPPAGRPREETFLKDLQEKERQGREWADKQLALITANTNQGGGDKPRPHWNELTRALYLGDKCIRRYNRGAATNQIDIIEEFERKDWPESVDDPFCDANKMRQTLYDLNKSLSVETIRFRADGTGESILWEYAT